MTGDSHHIHLALPGTRPDPPPVPDGLRGAYASIEVAAHLVEIDVYQIRQWIVDGRLLVSRRESSGKPLIPLDQTWLLAHAEMGES
jgi:hypothetical protein